MFISSLNNKKEVLFSKVLVHSRIKSVILWLIYSLFFVACVFSLALDKIYPLNIVLIGIWLALIALIFIFVLIFGRIKLGFFILLMFAFISLQFVSWAFNAFKVFNQTGFLLGIMSIFLYEFCVQENVKKEYLIYLFVVATWVFMIIFIVTNFRQIFSLPSTDKIGTNLGNTNDVARHLAYSILVNFAFVFISKRIFLKLMFLLVTILGFYLVFLTGSVSNLLSLFFVISIAIVIFLKRRYKWLAIVSILSIIAIGVVIFNAPFMAYYKNRVIAMFESFFASGAGGGDDSFEARLLAAMYGFGLFVQSPFVGNGFDAVYLNYNIMAHNNIVEVIADFGLTAFVIEELIILSPLLFYKKYIHSTCKPLILLVLLYTILFQLFLVSYNSKVELILIPIIHSFIFEQQIFSKFDCIFKRRSICPNYKYSEVNI